MIHDKVSHIFAIILKTGLPFHYFTISFSLDWVVFRLLPHLMMITVDEARWSVHSHWQLGYSIGGRNYKNKKVYLGEYRWLLVDLIQAVA